MEPLRELTYYKMLEISMPNGTKYFKIKFTIYLTKLDEICGRMTLLVHTEDENVYFLCFSDDQLIIAHDKHDAS
jgi:hypothetical protein